MLILGIDPGLRTTGYAILEMHGEHKRVLRLGEITPGQKDSLVNRIFYVFSELRSLLSQFEVKESGIEDIFFSQMTPTVLSVAQVRGAMISALVESNVRVFSYTPTQIKQVITGNGRANKVHVAEMVRLLLKLDISNYSDHVTDALAIALCHSFLRG